MSADKTELHIQRELVKFLRAKDWLVERMLANAFQMGIPDLYCHHKQHGSRWVEIKRPEGYSFTLRQRQKWPVWEQEGIGIWILTAANDQQYGLLFGPPNWRDFWKSSFAIPDGNAMFDELAAEYERSQEQEQN